MIGHAMSPVRALSLWTLLLGAGSLAASAEAVAKPEVTVKPGSKPMRAPPVLRRHLFRPQAACDSRRASPLNDVLSWAAGELRQDGLLN